MGRTQRRGLLTDRGAGRSTENVLFKSKTSCFTLMGRHFSGEKDALFSDKTSCFTFTGGITVPNISRARAYIPYRKHRAPMHPVHPSSGVRGYEGTGVREIWVHGVHGCTVFSFNYIARVRAHRYNGAEPAVDSNQWSVFLQGGKAEWQSARSRVTVRTECAQIVLN
jgi:hypothetical protein